MQDLHCFVEHVGESEDVIWCCSVNFIGEEDCQTQGAAGRSSLIGGSLIKHVMEIEWGWSGMDEKKTCILHIYMNIIG